MDGAELWAVDGGAGDALGTAVAAAGDWNGDGYGDFAAGAPGHAGGRGRVQVFSGRNGKLLATLDGLAAGDAFGAALADAGDVDGDGRTDLAIGAPDADPNGASSGAAYVHAGGSGALLYALAGDAAGDRLGAAVAGLGDLDGDGFGELAVGAPGDDDAGAEAGSVRVHDGPAGALRWEREGLAAGDATGAALAGTGDVDGDGLGEVLVGAPGAAGTAGAAILRAGASGVLVFTFTGAAPGVRFGQAVGGTGDLNGDGLGDYLVGAFLDDRGGADAGSAVVYWGSFGAAITTFYGAAPGDQLGVAVAGVGDLDGDGRGDFALGARLADGGGTNAGAVLVVAGQGRIGVNYCGPAVTNSTGLSARIAALGSSTVSQGDLTLEALRLPPGQFGYFLASKSQGFVPNPGGSQGNLCLGGTIGRFVKLVQQADPAGTFDVQVDMASMPPPLPPVVKPGETWFFQAWYRDLNPTVTSNFTDGVRVQFQ